MRLFGGEKGGRFVRYLAAFALFVAAILKAYSPAESALLSAAYDIPVWATVLLVQAELALAYLLIVGPRVREVHLTTLVLFSLFASFSLYRALAGYESCGCFGAVKVNPWWTFGMDLVIVGLLVITRPKKTSFATKSFAPAMILFLITGLPIGFLMVSTSPSELANATLTSVGGLIILDPEEWIDKPFPLADKIEPRIDISEGEWSVLIHHHDCPDCREARPKYEQLRGTGANVLLIESPPFAETGPLGTGKKGHAWLSDNHEWFVQAPVEIELREGIVQSVSHDLPRIAASYGSNDL